jgi:hypothetical protein
LVVSRTSESWRRRRARDTGVGIYNEGAGVPFRDTEEKPKVQG